MVKSSKDAPVLADFHHSKYFQFHLTVLNADVLVLLGTNALPPGAWPLSAQCFPLVAPGLSELSITQRLQGERIRWGSGEINEEGDKNLPGLYL